MSTAIANAPTWAIYSTVAGFIIGGYLLGLATNARKIARLTADLDHADEISFNLYSGGFTQTGRTDRTTDTGFARMPTGPGNPTPVVPTETDRIVGVTETGTILLAPIPVAVPWYHRPLLALLAWWEDTRPRTPEQAAREADPELDRLYTEVEQTTPRAPATPGLREQIAGTDTGAYPILARR